MNRDHLCTRTRRRGAFARTLAATLATCAGLLGAVSGALAASSPLTETLSQKHPGDVGIASDPAVVWYEPFSLGTVAEIAARYDSPQNPQRMELVEDHPANSPGTHSMQFTAGVVNGVTLASVSLFKNLGRGGRGVPADVGNGYDELYFRYYAKYVNAIPHHSGLWFGGFNPPQNFASPNAGTRPSGDRYFSIALEPIYTFPGAPIDFYNYWVEMRSFTGTEQGQFFGNTLLHYPQLMQDFGSWDCYEIHLKLNPNPEVGTGAVLELWKNDELVQSFNDSGPVGFLITDNFCANDAQGVPCVNNRPANPTFVLLNQRYRTTEDLKINFFWPQNFDTSGGASLLRYDDMVVAKQRIGCIVKK